MLTMYALQSSGATPPHQLDGLNLERLISLLSASSTRTSEVATQVLAQYCQCANMEVLARLAQEPNVASALMQLLLSQNGGQEAAVTALALLTSSSVSMAAQCTVHPHWQHSLLSLLKHSKPAGRLAACVCLRNICLTPDIQDKIGATTVETLHRAMLPVLLKLLHMPNVLDTAPQVLTDLLQQSPAMQKAANDSDAVSSLTTLLHHEQTWHNRPRFKDGVLRALAILCKNHGDARMNFMERASIGQVARALDDADLQVRAAACACIQSLSGSMKCLRHIPMAELMPPMLRLLLQTEPELQHSALKALSNLVLDTASAKDSVAQSAGLPAMVQMVGTPDDERRCSAMWALANLIHGASPAVCDAVMAALPWSQFLPLLQDDNSCVQDKSFMFMRNLAAGRSAAECVKQWSHGSAVPALVARMQKVQPPQHILVHILYCLSNFASTGSEEDRDAIASVAGECIKAHLHHEGVEVRTAALWVILNLTDGADDDAPDRAMKRIQQFQSLGTEERLRDMLQDMSLDVRERVSTALNNFGCTSSDTSEF
ncbi:TPA: hypothetical protein ACH3X1_015194 [Trebouxia sp. C0004]